MGQFPFTLEFRAFDLCGIILYLNSFPKVLTTISAADIMTSDISGADITEPDNVKGDECMGQLALTEAVFYILLSLQEPLHGYGIIQNVETLSHGRVKLAAGTLYGAINTLLDKSGSMRFRRIRSAERRNMSSRRLAGMC